MVQNLLQTPSYWLILEDCEATYNHFSKLIDFDQPLDLFDTRFPDRLEGILGSVRQSFSGSYLNPTILDASVAYFYQLIVGHPFQNGNKRIAILYTHMFLLSHNLDFDLRHDELYKIALVVASASQNKIPEEVVKQTIRELFAKFIIDYKKR